MQVLLDQVIYINKKSYQKLTQAGITTVADLLFYLPLRYENRSQLTPIHAVQINTNALVLGKITAVKINHRRQLLVTISDQQASIMLCFFHYAPWQLKSLQVGASITCYGQISANYYHTPQVAMLHPEYKILAADHQLVLPRYLTAIYPNIAGMLQQTIRNLVSAVLQRCEQQPELLAELIPAQLLAQYQLGGLRQTLAAIHCPALDADLVALHSFTHHTQQRLIIEELVAYKLAALQLRQKQTMLQATALLIPTASVQQLLHSLPFSLTNAQQRVLSDIQRDLTKSTPMLRLVQGDVGCGKTIIAALAILQAVMHGAQAALMAPTEILAEQHYQNLRSWFAPLNIEVGLLAQKTKAATKKYIKENLQLGALKVVIGTHALLQADVKFHNLALVVIDEQHRFGVAQRCSLWQKGQLYNNIAPHQLVLTATPIPRTLAMTLYADLDYSIIDELPPGRKPIKTVAIARERRAEVVARLRSICAAGQQVYWVCTLIANNPTADRQAAVDLLATLQQELPDLSIGLLHGKLAADEKQLVMAQFKDNHYQILVATTVIEVGVDVSNASLMIIENPERLGLAQLHQLRGRVGRGAFDSYCVLLYDGPLTEQGFKRLDILRQTQDGFKIAECDLELRGSGQILGTQQTGNQVSFTVADVARDRALLPTVQQLAQQLWRVDPERAQLLITRWLRDNIQYGHVS